MVAHGDTALLSLGKKHQTKTHRVITANDSNMSVSTCSFKAWCLEIYCMPIGLKVGIFVPH